MPAIAEQVTDRFIGHDVELLRLAESERETIFRMLGQLQTSLLDKMQGQIPLPGFGTFSQRKTQALFTLTDKLIAQKYGQIAREHHSTLIDLAEFESDRTRKLVNAQIGVALLGVGVPLSTLKALVNDDLVEGRPAKEWWSQQSDNLRGRFQQTIRQGVFAGETLGQLQQRVRGTKARNFQDGIMAITSRNAEALIRTSVQSVANAARHETFKANDDVLGGFQALVTLDTRTSELCMSRSGFAWDLEGNPLNDETKIPFPGPPPWHFNALAESTRILTSTGQRPIEEIRVGERVLTHRGRWRRVYATMAKEYESSVIRYLHTDSGRILRTTNEHPVLTFREGWKIAGNLEIGDQLFDYPEQAPETRGCIAPLWLPDQYPPLRHEKAVPYEVVSLAVDSQMSAPIQFQQDPCMGEGKVGNVSINGELENERCVADRFESLKDRLFISSGIGTQPCSHCEYGFYERGRIGHWIAGQHALTMGAMNRRRFLAHAVGPVPLPARTLSISGRTGLIDGNGVSPTPQCYSMLFAPEIQFAGWNAKGSLNGPDRLFPIDMPCFDDPAHNFSVGQIDHLEPPWLPCWTRSTIISIAEQRYQGKVFNLAVEEDETYLAEGVIVHNCRTTLVPVLKSWAQLRKEAKQDEDLGKKLDRIEGKVGKGTQASLDGQVAADLTYDEWLKARPAEDQIAALGRGRWQLWRRNLIDLQDLVDQRGNPVTLDDLKSRAGVDNLENLNTRPRGLDDPQIDTIIPEARPEDNPLPAQRELAALPVTSIKRNPDSGANGSKIVTYLDKRKGVFKPLSLEEPDLRPGIENYYQREALATEIAAIVRYNDLVPTTAVTTIRKEVGSVQAFVEGAKAAVKLDRLEMFGSSERDIRRSMLFDAVLGNTDRHSKNWMVTNEGKLVLIDHGLMLSTQNQWLHIGFKNGLAKVQLKRAIPENMKLPWRKAWPKMQASLETRGVEPEAIRLAKQRLDRILKPGTTWGSIEEPL